MSERLALRLSLEFIPNLTKRMEYLMLDRIKDLLNQPVFLTLQTQGGKEYSLRVWHLLVATLVLLVVVL